MEFSHARYGRIISMDLSGPSEAPLRINIEAQIYDAATNTYVLNYGTNQHAYSSLTIQVSRNANPSRINRALVERALEVAAEHDVDLSEADVFFQAIDRG